MCTVTYLPLTQSGYILTSSRDEHQARPAAIFPANRCINGLTVSFPLDPQGQGSWIATVGATTVCLLNGAFTAHQPWPRQGPGSARQSRGKVVLDYFRYPSTQAFLKQYDFSGIEPFTLVIVDDEQLTELRWDGRCGYIAPKETNRAHIWSSVTLYTPEVIVQREQWFREWLLQPQGFGVSGIRQFHKQAGNADPANAIRMCRDNGMQTVSLTSVVATESATELIYDDFLTATSSQQLILTHHESFAIR